MNTAQQKPQPSLLTQLPPQVQKQVLLLIKRLGDQKQAKQDYQKKCIAQQQQIQNLLQQIQRLKKQNLALRTKWQNSFSMISKVRQNFTNNNNNNNTNTLIVSSNSNMNNNMNKRLKFNTQRNQWTVKQQQNTKQGQPNSHIRQEGTFSIASQQRGRVGSKGQQENYNGKLLHSGRSLQKSSEIINKESPQIMVVNLMTAKKPPRSSQNHLNSSSRSKLQSSNKKQQIQTLKQEIETLTEEIKCRQAKDMSLQDKMRRCEQIKNRYRKGSDSKEKSSKQIANNQSQLSLTTRGHSRAQQTTVHKIQQASTSPTSNTNANSFANKNRQNISSKQNMMMGYDNSNDLEIENNSMINNSCFVDNNSSFLNNTSIVGHSFTTNTPKQQQLGLNCNNKPHHNTSQSLIYDDGLLDLIEEMNP